jgi:fatty-acyl-CoA synthase
MENFTKILKRIFDEDPDRVSIFLLQSNLPDIPITYRTLLHGTAGYAKTYKKMGINPGDVVILILQHGIDLIYAYYGAILHGAVPSIMPFLTEKLLPERYRKDLASLISITKPAGIVTNMDFEAEVRSALNPDDSVRTLILTNLVEDPCIPDFDKLAGFDRNNDDIVLLQHSSGTTGLQKGVALSHQAVINQLDSYRTALDLREEKDVIVSWLPLYHDMGLIACFIFPVLSKIPLVLLSPFDWVRAPYRLFQTISLYKGTLCWLPNFAYNFCAQKIRDRNLENVDLSSLRAVINCSEPMRLESHMAFFERFKQFGLRYETLATCYAMAENVFAVTQGGLDGPVLVDEIDRETLQLEKKAKGSIIGKASIKMLSAGKPILNVKVCILDENGNSIQDRLIGEIAIKSNCMLTGYYNKPDLSQKSFINGWYLTGDLGYMVSEEVFITGRKKDLIIVGGKNVYPQDIEQLAMEVPGVHQGRVVAFGIFNEEMGTEEVEVIAEVNLEEPEKLELISDQIRQAVTRGSAISLRQVLLVKKKWLIKTSSGKVARSANKEKYLKEYQSVE